MGRSQQRKTPRAPIKLQVPRLFGVFVILFFASTMNVSPTFIVTRSVPRISDSPLAGCPSEYFNEQEWVACYTTTVVPEGSNITWSFDVWMWTSSTPGTAFDVMAMNAANFTVPTPDQWYIVFQNVGFGQSAIGYCASCNSSSMTRYQRAPRAPIITATLSDAQTIIHLYWNSSGCGGAHLKEFKIYRGTSSGGEIYIGNTSFEYWYDKLEAWKTYYYQVISVNGNGTSPASAEVAIYMPPTEFFLIVGIVGSIVGVIIVACWLIHKVRHKYPDPRRW